ncbi:MAG: hypothetical protein AVDCRST_MAG02-4586 [uncultured Rubrobacteraceae bacterium]|uniref:EfeO-type cupredoxin-like domain-containing protein n=1 Tax=uncultured Rubrobacteraceae bacterium TaxID=349277 RepID=A0A6J4RWD9_9ACTN|nr:MAG: hypothetical protein AVDCRST_MAG02-4586 [uncultured Rubrobacteraceae bacterium]
MVVRSLGALVVALVVLVGLFLVLRPESHAAGPRERTFKVSVEDGEMVPRELRVGEGDRVTVRVEAGEPVELHLHGYGIEWGAGPEEGAAVSFGAGLTGRFGIEDHRSGEDLGVLVVGPR